MSYRVAWIVALITYAGCVIFVVLMALGVFVPSPAAGPVPLSSGALPGATSAATPGATASPAPSGAATRGEVATRIVVPRLGIDLPIYEGDGVTADLGKAAHYPTTAWPESGTLIYLYSHAVDENFVALWDAEVGDVIELELEDGSTVTYEVSRILPEVAWNDLSVLEPTGRELLRLQTCNSYEETAPRFLVEAVPAEA